MHDSNARSSGQPRLGPRWLDDLTPRQRRAYRYLLQHRLRTGTLPLVEDLRQALGLRSRAAAHYYVAQLAKAGLVRSGKRGVRALRRPFSPPRKED